MRAAAVALLLCGATAPTAAVAAHGTFGQYPGYNGTLAVGGTFDVTDVAKISDRKGLFVQYHISGADNKCAAGALPGVKNSCGVHIHEGEQKCDDAATVGGHYYDAAKFDADPWASIGYATDRFGVTRGEFGIYCGHAVEDVAGRVMVVHDSTGARVACGQIKVGY